jgi:hypothetical protein
MQQIDSSTAVWISFLLCQPHSFQVSFKDKGRQYKPLQFVGGQDKTRQDKTTQHNTPQENTIQGKAHTSRYKGTKTTNEERHEGRVGGKIWVARVEKTQGT